MKNKILPFFFIIFLINQLAAQDAHFTQFFQSPTLLNPSLAGTQSCHLHAIIQYKGQGRTISPTPYRTLSATLEQRFDFDRTDDVFVGVGLNLFRDQAGINQYQITQALLTAAVHLKIGSTQYLSAGFQGGAVERAVDFSSMIFDKQFNGLFYDMNIPTGENLGAQQKFHGDLAAGIAFSNIGHRRIHVGVAAFHLNTPNISFIENLYGNELPYKFTIYAAGSVPLGGRRINNAVEQAIVGHIIFLTQEPFNEINAGIGYRWTVNRQLDLYAGGIFKLNDSPIGSRQEAISPVFNMTIDGLKLGLSVDFSLNSMVRANYGFASFELVMAKAFGKQDCRDVICPTNF